jgi:hypothetical protein
MGVWVYLDEVDRHYEVAKEAGDEIAHPSKDLPWPNLLSGRSRRLPWFLHLPAKGGLSALQFRKTSRALNFERAPISSRESHAKRAPNPALREP